MDAGTLIRTSRKSAGLSQGAHRHGAKNVRIFGSGAPGEDQPGSDIDLLVDLDVHSKGLFPLAALQDELSELLGERVDIVSQDALDAHVAVNALAEAVPL
jgi:predicted nucleotidyltransferase